MPPNFRPIKPVRMRLAVRVDKSWPSFGNRRLELPCYLIGQGADLHIKTLTFIILGNALR